MQRLRRLATSVTTVGLGLLLLAVLLFQCRDFKGAAEVLPLTTFAVMLSLAGFAISWARLNPPLATPQEVLRVKRAAMDLLIASLLTLLSACLLLLAQDGLLKATPFMVPVLVLHLLCLAVGLLFGWLGVTAMLRQAQLPIQES